MNAVTSVSMFFAIASAMVIGAQVPASAADAVSVTASAVPPVSPTPQSLARARDDAVVTDRVPVWSRS
ncbi:hypothetical protein [Streptomyces sp. NPDC056227]|uniref:hypothetical protein n=1 Tax=Streptomyces sp. NPDC056227 TaxID=3345753 RepID=UPI0035E0E5C1